MNNNIKVIHLLVLIQVYNIAATWFLYVDIVNKYSIYICTLHVYTIVFVNICNMKKKDLHFFDNFFKNLFNHKMIRYRSEVQKCKINRH